MQSGIYIKTFNSTDNNNDTAYLTKKSSIYILQKILEKRNDAVQVSSGQLSMVRYTAYIPKRGIILHSLFTNV